MYPNYRTTAADRRDRLAFGCLVAGIVVLLGSIVAAYAALGYVGAHFVAKFW